MNPRVRIARSSFRGQELRFVVFHDVRGCKLQSFGGFSELEWLRNVDLVSTLLSKS